MWFSKILAITSLALMAGCVLPKNVVVDLPDDEGQIGRVSVSNRSGDTELNRPLAAVGLEAGAAPGKPFITDQQALKSVFGKVLKATPRPPVLFTINFVPGTVLIAPESQTDLARAIALAKTTSYSDVGVIEHYDSTAIATPDDALMIARAQGIAGRLVSNGVSPSAVQIQNYGPAIPLPQAAGALPPNAPIGIIIR